MEEKRDERRKTRTGKNSRYVALFKDGRSESDGPNSLFFKEKLDRRNKKRHEMPFFSGGRLKKSEIRCHQLAIPEQVD